MEQIAQKICIYQKIVVPLQRFSYLNWILCYGRTPYAVIARGVLLPIWLKILSILRKINFFLKKKVEKICTYRKNVVPLHQI